MAILLKKYKVHLIILGKIRTCNFAKNGHILCNKLKIKKTIVNARLNSH